jgi:rSAM/selenodomain-associated transferase 2
MPSPSVSIIIPALNERSNLPTTVASLPAGVEVLVVDGGSTDGTREWVLSKPYLRLLDAPRGRGPQLAAGAQAATGDILLFLHADCQLPKGALDTILAAGATAGCFSVRFAESEPFSLTATAWAINTHSRLTRTATGDQAIWCSRAAYNDLGGFSPWPLFEDVDFVDRLKRRGRFVVLPQKVTISARRWLTLGVGRTNLLMIVLWCGYRLGVPPTTLKRWFRDVRPKKQP